MTADFDFDGVADLIMREHAEAPDTDVREAIALQLRRAHRHGFECGVDACTKDLASGGDA